MRVLNAAMTTTDTPRDVEQRVTYYSSGDVAAAKRVIELLMQRPIATVLPLPV